MLNAEKLSLAPDMVAELHAAAGGDDGSASKTPETEALRARFGQPPLK